MGRPRLASDDDILDATARAVSRHGPGSLTLATVAEQAGITAAAILQRFGSKHGLLLALSRRSTAGAAEAVEAAMARSRSGSALDALAELLTGDLGAVDSPDVLANHVGMLQLDLTDPELRAEARRHAAAVRHGVEQLLHAAVDAGELELPPGVGCARLAEAVESTYNGALVTWALTPRGSLPAWVRGQVTFLLDRYRPRA